MHERLEPSAIVLEFLQIMRNAPVLPRPLRPMQTLLIKAAVQITPAWVRERLGLDRRWHLRPWQRYLVKKTGQAADRLLLSPARRCSRADSLACRTTTYTVALNGRLGVPSINSCAASVNDA